jgi:hypothetical protein
MDVQSSLTIVAQTGFVTRLPTACGDFCRGAIPATSITRDFAFAREMSRACCCVDLACLTASTSPALVAGTAERFSEDQRQQMIRTATDQLAEVQDGSADNAA